MEKKRAKEEKEREACRKEGLGKERMGGRNGKNN